VAILCYRPQVRALLRYFDRRVKAARERAMGYVRDAKPSCIVTSARLRAEEESRYVFAVFHREPDVWVTPGQYQLVAVAKEGDAVEELETSPVSPYWIRGLK